MEVKADFAQCRHRRPPLWGGPAAQDVAKRWFGLDAGSIGTRIRLRERKGRCPFPTRNARQVFLLLLRAAIDLASLGTNASVRSKTGAAANIALAKPKPGYCGQFLKKPSLAN